MNKEQIKTQEDYGIFLLTKAREMGYPYFDEILSKESRKKERELKEAGEDEYHIQIVLKDYQEMLNILYAGIVNKEIEEAIFMWERMETDLRERLIDFLVQQVDPEREGSRSV